MARIAFPLELGDEDELERLSYGTGLAVSVLVDLWRRGFEAEQEENLDEW